ncbi:MAG TPA: hypothetical protein PK200_11130 [Spirochaetota bacterium]|nr:hypothetical protein [Spirochaetota bacterium]HQO03698.1 hypothetical protein [Spirochaetota bacterium]HQP49565.1 hypothetical protein [Spirochaetota bacterium]
MDTMSLSILHYIFTKTKDGNFLSLYELEIEFGITGSDLQPVLEDLKEDELIIESDECYQISDSGINFGRSKWI